jgi:zinc transport system ATP-binding protein
MPLAVELRHVCFAYPGGPEVLHDVDLDVEAGEFVAIAGPNGGGKTTLLRVAVGLEQPARGEALLFGEPVSQFGRRGRIGYLAQRAQLGIDAPATVREVVESGRVSRWLVGRGGGAGVDEAIERVGLARKARWVLSRLSGGQQQRAFLAKALVARPDLLVLDEPTAGVDVDAQEALAALLEELHRAIGMTILFCSHEFGAVEQYVDRLVLVRGGIVFDGDPAALPTSWHDPSHVHP